MVSVVKRSGEREEFDREKVRHALVRAGAPPALAEEIAKKVESQAYDGVTTGRIYGLAYHLLEGEHARIAAKFSLKQAIMMLGPTGFPFEKYMAKVLAKHGYATETNLALKGACVDEEVDIAAEKAGTRYMVECKYHNEQGFVTGLKEALYTYARFEDVIGGGNRFNAPWIITNTKITDEAAKYASCKGMKATSWGYPPGETLQDLIECECIYPVTMLPGITGRLAQKLMQKGIVIAQDVKTLNPEELSSATGLTQERLQKLIRQIEELTDKTL
jgi:hypothetical protein